MLRSLLMATTATFLCVMAARAAPIIWVDDASGRIGTVDVATGTVTPIGNSGADLTDIAFSPTQNLYGVSFSTLYTINQTTGAATTVGNFGGGVSNMNGLVFNSNGTLYGSGGNSLYTINPTTGAATLVGPSGLSGFSSAGDLIFSGGNLYESVTNGTISSLARINPTTGAGTLVGTIVNDPTLFGLVVGSDGNVYGVDGTNIYSINLTTGAGTLVRGYTSASLGQAFGAAARTESGGGTGGGVDVPEPASLGLLGLALTGLGFVRRRQRG